MATSPKATRTPDSTGLPVSDGFRMPAEWAPHARTWMAWPVRAAAFGARIEAAREAYAEVAQAIAAFEPVTMVAPPEQVAAVSLACGSGVATLAQPIDDSWVRDNGPSFVVNAEGEVAGVHWGFNAWGGKFPPWERDAELGRAILANLGMARYAAPFVLEGGSIHVDGEGTLLTTEECLLNPNRNPSLSRKDIERGLAAHLGIDRVVWLGQGLENDETDGHVDNLACFARPGVVVLQGCADPLDPNHAVALDARTRLAAARDAKGRAFEVVELPSPRRRMHPRGDRLPLSYVNYVLCNGGLVMPAFDDPADGKAYEILQRLFPERRITQVPALEILYGGGGIHCTTQQQPAGPPAP